MYSTRGWLRCHLEFVIGINFTVFVSINSEFKHCWRRLRWEKVKKYLMQNGVSRSSTHANVTPSSADICIFHKSSRLFTDNADSRLDPTTFCQFSSPVRYSRYSSCETQRVSRWIVERYSDWSYRKEQHTMLYHWGLTYLSIRYVFLYWGTLINDGLLNLWADCPKRRLRSDNAALLTASVV